MNYLEILKQADEAQPNDDSEDTMTERTEIAKKVFEEIEKMNIDCRLRLSSDEFQDSACFAQIIIKHKSGEISKIVFSEMAGLIGVSNEAALGVYMRRIVDVIKRSNRTYIPESLLRSPYCGQDQGYDSWWHRFFDYQ